jgi:hypothetical protein
MRSDRTGLRTIDFQLQADAAAIGDEFREKNNDELMEKELQAKN